MTDNERFESLWLDMKTKEQVASTARDALRAYIEEYWGCTPGSLVTIVKGVIHSSVTKHAGKEARVVRIEGGMSPSALATRPWLVVNLRKAGGDWSPNKVHVYANWERMP